MISYWQAKVFATEPWAPALGRQIGSFFPHGKKSGFINLALLTNEISLIVISSLLYFIISYYLRSESDNNAFVLLTINKIWCPLTISMHPKILKINLFYTAAKKFSNEM